MLGLGVQWSRVLPALMWNSTMWNFELRSREGGVVGEGDKEGAEWEMIFSCLKKDFSVLFLFV